MRVSAFVPALRRILPLLVAFTMIGLCSWQPVVAGPGGDKPGPAPAGITQERPFLPGIPDWEVGVKLAKAVINEDEGAEKQVEDSGLSYFPQLRRLAASHPVTRGALRRHLEWLGVMTEWEILFAGAPPAEIAARYETLQPRFVSADAQLARVILYAQNWGDTATRDALCKKNASSPWVKAVRAWMGLTTDPKTAAGDLMAITGEVEALGRYPFTFVHMHFEDRPQNVPATGIAGWEWEIEDVKTAKSVRELLMMPLEFYDVSMYERLGAICAESGDNKLIDNTEAALAQRARDLKLPEYSLSAFAISARYASEKVAAMPQGILGYCAQESTGPGIIGYAVHALPDTDWFGRAAAAIAAWANMPDYSLTRRFMLSRLMVLDDDMLRRLAARAALAAQDDDKAACNDVARALLRFGSHKDLAAAFAKAMNDTGQADLKVIAAALTKGDPAPLDAVVRGPLNLKLEQKAALLNVFVFDEERAAFGGPVGVYWMNKATFLEGARNIAGAAEAYWMGMEAASAKSGDVANAALQRWHLFRERSLRDEVAAQDLAAASQARPKLADKARRFLAESGDLTKPISSNAFARAYGDYFAGQPLSDDLYKELSTQPARWGGAGLALCAECDLNNKRYTQRRALWEKALRYTPADPFLHMVMGPDAETFGTFAAANWDLACRHSLAHALLLPFSLDSVALLATTCMRSGSMPMAPISLARGSLRRAPDCLWGSLSFRQLAQFTLNPGPVAYALMRTAQSRPDRLGGIMERLVQATLISIRGLIQDYEVVRYCIYLNPQGCNYARGQAQACANRHNLQDVNVLLDLAYSCSQALPDYAIKLVDKAEEIGVSKFGRFVGTQALVLAHAQNGTLDEVLDRYHEMRGGRTGVPAYLDLFMLAGLFRGGNVKQAKLARDAIDKYTLDTKSAFFLFFWRRLLMAQGEHAALADIGVPAKTAVLLDDAPQYSELFHESRALLDAGNFDAILERTKPYLDVDVECGMGVYLDAAILAAVARKAAGKSVTAPAVQGQAARLNVIPVSLADMFLDADNSMDALVFEMLCGRAPTGVLPETTWKRLWQGQKYGERTPGYYGGGIITYAECKARESFIRGVLAWLSNDNATAVKELKSCMLADQRFSHEYHVAEWLLANPLAEKKEGK